MYFRKAEVSIEDLDKEYRDPIQKYLGKTIYMEPHMACDVSVINPKDCKNKKYLTWKQAQTQFEDKIQ